MEIFYVHHALRDKGNPPTQEDGIKKLGIEDANIVGKIFEEGKKYWDFKAIYTSPFKRCKETAEIINKYLNVPVIEDDRFNELGSVLYPVSENSDEKRKETWQECQTRIIEALHDIVLKHGEKDTVVCVTSGVNLTAFVSVAYGIKPNNDLPYPMVSSCSPIGFNISEKNFKNII